VTMDLRGRGRSEITPSGSYGWDSHVRDLLEIAEYYGADSFVMIGHSMGGFIGLSLAASIRGGAAISFSSTPSASLRPALCRPSPNPQQTGPDRSVDSGDAVIHVRRRHHCSVE
jgi:pimeloyl-ACP methyl ester carboxylesterase